MVLSGLQVHKLEQVWTDMVMRLTRVLSIQRSMINLTFPISLLKIRVKVKTPTIMTQITYFQSLKE
jgi:hypothetical protein